MTEQYSVLTPKFYRDFNCAGADCEDHCCHTWNVSVNKSSYKNLKKEKNKEVQNLVIEHFKLTKKSDMNWAFIQMDETGKCPILDNDGLCQIHSKIGHKHLPHTCQDYPRHTNLFGSQVEPSLFISCPIAAKNVLFDPSAMMFEQSETSVSQLNKQRLSGLNEADLPNWAMLIREVCFQIILDNEASFEERIFSLGLFLKQAETRLSSAQELQSFVDNFIQIYNEKRPHQMYVSLPSIDNLKWQVFSTQDNLLIKNTNLFKNEEGKLDLSSSTIRFQKCRDFLLALLNNEGKPTPFEKYENGTGKFDRKVAGDSAIFNTVFRQGNEEYLSNYFESKPQILTNYALYYIYHNQFFIRQNKSLFEFFKVMVIDLFMLKSYLAAIAFYNKEINDDWVLVLFQSYARRRQHVRMFTDKMEDTLKQSNTDSAAAIFGLLK